MEKSPLDFQDGANGKSLSLTQLDPAETIISSQVESKAVSGTIHEEQQLNETPNVTLDFKMWSDSEDEKEEEIDMAHVGAEALARKRAKENRKKAGLEPRLLVQQRISTNTSNPKLPESMPALPPKNQNTQGKYNIFTLYVNIISYMRTLSIKRITKSIFIT